jgi:hypothetical protein
MHIGTRSFSKLNNYMLLNDKRQGFNLQHEILDEVQIRTCSSII